MVQKYCPWSNVKTNSRNTTDHLSISLQYKIDIQFVLDIIGMLIPIYHYFSVFLLLYWLFIGMGEWLWYYDPQGENIGGILKWTIS